MIRQPNTTLSIPLWCDWDAGYHPRPAVGHGPFNPTVVRLGRGRRAAGQRAQPSFNPTVVRLGRLQYLHQLVHQRSFNPTVVRLGLPKEAPPVLVITDFQSHCGAIGTSSLRFPSSLTNSTFNPTVVRLGRGIARHLALPQPIFQSHCGAIGTGR